MKRLFLFSLLCIATFVGASAQTILHHLPVPHSVYNNLGAGKAHVMAIPYNPKVRIVIADSTLPILLHDSVFQGLRWTGLTGLYAYQFAHGPQVAPGALFFFTGVAYEHDVFSSKNGRWSTTWAIGGGLGGGVQQINGTATFVPAAGLYINLLDKYLVIGLIYNFRTGEPMMAGGPNGPLVPNN